MAILDHLSVGAPSIDDACAFYDGLMKTLGAARLAANDQLAAYGNSHPEFLVMKPYDKGEQTFGNGVHIAFKAADRAAVDAFHKFAIGNGGTCEGQPGGRDGYPNPDVYTAYVRDPFGNKLEVIFNGFAG